MVHFVGAGSGAPDLITVRGKKYLEEADVVIYAGSLVNPKLLEYTKDICTIYNSAKMTLEEVLSVMEKAEAAGKTTVRLHTGDPCIYGAIREQMDVLDEKGIAYDYCPGVSAFCGAASALNLEYTLPDISQSVIITRMAGRTPVPDRESIASFAVHQTSMVLFLSAGMLRELSAELIKGGYPADTPAAIVYKATWPEEKIVRCEVKNLAEAAEAEGITKTALIIVGEAVGQKDYERSKLYDPCFETEYRKAQNPEMGEACGKAEDEKTGDLRQKEGRTGRLYVVGIGPGSAKGMTGEARQALERCQVIAGYTVYADLVRDEFPQKEYLTTPMTREEERCRMAIACCLEGKDTAMICSGDGGVYGMAGLLLELAEETPQVEICVVPGVTAACSGAAALGAPLMHDFAVISLSDRLTPICGLAKRIGREGEETEILTLKELMEAEADMFTTVYIGNSSTKQIGGHMVTPRGYERKYFSGKDA